MVKKTIKYNVERLLKESEKRVLNENEILYLSEKLGILNPKRLKGFYKKYLSLSTRPENKNFIGIRNPDGSISVTSATDNSNTQAKVPHSVRNKDGSLTFSTLGDKWRYMYAQKHPKQNNQPIYNAKNNTLTFNGVAYPVNNLPVANGMIRAEVEDGTITRLQAINLKYQLKKYYQANQMMKADQDKSKSSYKWFSNQDMKSTKTGEMEPNFGYNPDTYSTTVSEGEEQTIQQSSQADNNKALVAIKSFLLKHPEATPQNIVAGHYANQGDSLADYVTKIVQIAQTGTSNIDWQKSSSGRRSITLAQRKKNNEEQGVVTLSDGSEVSRQERDALAKAYMNSKHLRFEPGLPEEKLNLYASQQRSLEDQSAFKKYQRDQEDMEFLSKYGANYKPGIFARLFGSSNRRYMPNGTEIIGADGKPLSPAAAQLAIDKRYRRLFGDKNISVNPAALKKLQAEMRDVVAEVLKPNSTEKYNITRYMLNDLVARGRLTAQQAQMLIRKRDEQKSPVQLSGNGAFLMTKQDEAERKLRQLNGERWDSTPFKFDDRYLTRYAQGQDMSPLAGRKMPANKRSFAIQRDRTSGVSPYEIRGTPTGSVYGRNTTISGSPNTTGAFVDKDGKITTNDPIFSRKLTSDRGYLHSIYSENALYKLLESLDMSQNNLQGIVSAAFSDPQVVASRQSTPQTTNAQTPDSPLTNIQGTPQASAGNSFGQAVVNGLNGVSDIYKRFRHDQRLKNARWQNEDLYFAAKAAVNNPFAPIPDEIKPFLTSSEKNRINQMRAEYMNDMAPGEVPPWERGEAQRQISNEELSTSTDVSQSQAQNTPDLFKLVHGHFTPEALEYFKKAKWTPKEINDLKAQLLKRNEERAMKRNKEKADQAALKFSTTLGNNGDKIAQNLNAKLKQTNPSATSKFIVSGNKLIFGKSPNDPNATSILDLSKLSGVVGLNDNNTLVYEYTNRKGAVKKRLGTDLSSMFTSSTTPQSVTSTPQQTRKNPVPQTQSAPQRTATGNTTTASEKPTYNKRHNLNKVDPNDYNNIQLNQDNTKYITYINDQGNPTQYTITDNDLISDDGTEAIIHPKGAPAEGIPVALDSINNTDAILGSESVDIFTYSQFKKQFKEAIQSHSNEISPKNMYQLYLLGKLKKLL